MSGKNINSSVKEKKYPVRRCIGCGESFLKNDLIRVVRTPEGEIILDRTGKASGRGVYVCPKVECFKKGRKTGRFSSNLNSMIPDEIYEKIEKEIREIKEIGSI